MTERAEDDAEDGGLRRERRMKQRAEDEGADGG
jgi:hypothetical protein